MYRLKQDNLNDFIQSQFNPLNLSEKQINTVVGTPNQSISFTNH